MERAPATKKPSASYVGMQRYSIAFHDLNSYQPMTALAIVTFVNSPYNSMAFYTGVLVLGAIECFHWVWPL